MWTSNHDTLLYREILSEEPCKCKLGTREHGQCWDKIASNVNRIRNPHLWIDQRAVRDTIVDKSPLDTLTTLLKNVISAFIPLLFLRTPSPPITMV